MRNTIPKLITSDEAAAFLGLSPRTLEGWRTRGDGPDFVRMGAAVRYCIDDLLQFIEKNKIQRESFDCASLHREKVMFNSKL
jgi:hypothetical protein